MTRRRLVAVAALTIVFALGVAAVAWGSDLYQNIGPGTGTTGLAGRYPLGNYTLDQHFSAIKASLTGGVDASGVPAMIAFFLANLLWQITAFLANATITIFTAAFALDLVNGSAATQGQGALPAVGQAINRLYAQSFGQPWLIVGITLAGLWAMWHALVRRQYAQTISALGVSLCFVLLALAVVTQPDKTIGAGTRLSNQLSTALLSISHTGQATDARSAQQAASDELFDTLVLTPWAALDFGGSEHCVRTGTGDTGHQPTSVPVRPLDPAVERRLQSGQLVQTGKRTCASNTARYAQHLLAYPPESDDRTAEYDAINQADPSKLPDADPTKHTGTYKPQPADKPAVDAMEQGGQYQRLLLSIIVLIGDAGLIALLGGLAVAIVTSQLIVLLLALFSPVALVAATVPGRGHALFKLWATQLLTQLVRKAAYALLLAVLLTVLHVLQQATSPLGWLASYALQAALTWTIFLARHRLAGQLTQALSGSTPGRDVQLNRLLGIRTARRLTQPPARRPTTPARTTGEPARPVTEPASAPAAMPTTTPPTAPGTPPPDADAAADRPGKTGPAADATSISPRVEESTTPRHAHRHARTARQADPTGTSASPPTSDKRPTRPAAAAPTNLQPAAPVERPASARRSEPRPAASRPAARRTDPPPAPHSPGSPPEPPADRTVATNAPAAAPGGPVPDETPGLSEQLATDRQRLNQQPAPSDEPPAARRPATPDTAETGGEADAHA